MGFRGVCVLVFLLGEGRLCVRCKQLCVNVNMYLYCVTASVRVDCQIQNVNGNFINQYQYHCFHSYHHTSTEKHPVKKSTLPHSFLCPLFHNTVHHQKPHPTPPHPTSTNTTLLLPYLATPPRRISSRPTNLTFTAMPSCDSASLYTLPIWWSTSCWRCHSWCGACSLRAVLLTCHNDRVLTTC